MSCLYLHNLRVIFCSIFSKRKCTSKYVCIYTTIYYFKVHTYKYCTLLMYVKIKQKSLTFHIWLLTKASIKRVQPCFCFWLKLLYVHRIIIANDVRINLIFHNHVYFLKKYFRSLYCIYVCMYVITFSSSCYMMTQNSPYFLSKIT